jgi:membrane-associated protease RseP (regulator of RpoE activity)
MRSIYSNLWQVDLERTWKATGFDGASSRRAVPNKEATVTWIEIVAVALPVFALALAHFLAHEFGHVLGARLVGFAWLGWHVSRRGLGVVITDGFPEGKAASPERWAAVHTGGPAANVAAAVLMWVVLPGHYGSMALWSGLVFAAINLLPFVPGSDGGQLLREARRARTA